MTVKRHRWVPEGKDITERVAMKSLIVKFHKRRVCSEKL